MSGQLAGAGTGRWGAPIYGQRGKLTDDGVRVECHCCGQWFHHLGAHVRAAHGLTPDEYREEMGLNRGTGLTGPAYRAKLARMAARNFAASWPTAGNRARAITPEQRHAGGSGAWRAEAKHDPHNQAVQRAASQRGAETTRAAIAAGTWQPPTGRDPEAALVVGRAHLRELHADREWQARFRQRVSEGRGGRTEVVRACVICGKAFTIAATLAQRGEGKVCSPACARERRAQVLREHHSAKRPDVSSTRCRTGLERWRDNDAYRGITARLRSLPPQAFGALSERERLVVRLYYGLEEASEGPYTHRDIGVRLGLSRSRASQLRQAGLARLLGAGVTGDERRLGQSGE